MKKLLKGKEICHLDLDKKSIGEAIEYLKSLEKDFSKSIFTVLTIDADPIYEGGYRLNLCGDRLETDLEYENRLAREKTISEQRIARDRSEYERLKTLFENQR